MKKIGIITFHRANNYGVCLQAYATVDYLRRIGYDAKIIDYSNEHEQRIQKWAYKENEKLSGYLTSFLKNVLLGKKRYQRMAFGNIDSLYPLSSNKYTNVAQLASLEYDVIIAGSDQIWNSEITNGIDSAFLLQFGKATRRISIASSLGSTELTESDREKFKEALPSFAAISVREEFGKIQLQPLTSKRIKVLMDPTFLLDNETWIKVLGNKSKYIDCNEKFILTYFVSPDKDKYQEKVQAYAEKLKLPVWTVQYSNYRWKVSSKKILGATLEDFIALISNAELVLTDSFHGTAFSINLQSNFVAFKHKKNPVRVMGLLNNLGVGERLDMSASDYVTVDFAVVNNRLDEMRNNSRKWVVEAIEGNVENE